MRRSFLFFPLIALGIIAIVFGFIVGLGSHQVTYKVGRGKIDRYLSTGGTGYFQMSTSQTIYFVQENDFSPAINGAETFVKGDEISFFYDPSDITQANVESDKSHLTGTAYKVVQISSFVDQKPTIYTASVYQQSKAYYRNEWGKGFLFIASGLILAVLSIFFLTKKESQQSADATSVPAQAIPQSPPAYQQPFQAPIEQSEPIQPQPTPAQQQLFQAPVQPRPAQPQSIPSFQQSLQAFPQQPQPQPVNGIISTQPGWYVPMNVQQSAQQSSYSQPPIQFGPLPSHPQQPNQSGQKPSSHSHNAPTEIDKSFKLPPQRK